MPRKRLVPKLELPKVPTLADWAKDDVKRSRLVELLQDPVMQEAFATLSEAYASAIPSYVSVEGSPMTIPTAADLNNLLALRHAHKAGFFGFPNAMKNLTREKVLRRAERSPWGDLLPTE